VPSAPDGTRVRAISPNCHAIDTMRMPTCLCTLPNRQDVGDARAKSGRGYPAILVTDYLFYTTVYGECGGQDLDFAQHGAATDALLEAESALLPLAAHAAGSWQYVS
jgi:hypothetical protein